MEKTLALILAVDEQNWLGKNNTLAWKLSWDITYFKEITTTTLSSSKKNAVLMWRRTWESIPEKYKPLPHRKNYILTRDTSFQWWDGVFQSLEQALEILAQDDCIETIYIIGGSQIYNEVIKKDLADTIYLTQVLWVFWCDVFFLWIPANYRLESISEKQQESGIPYQFLVYKKEHDLKPLTNGKTLWETKSPNISTIWEDI